MDGAILDDKCAIANFREILIVSHDHEGDSMLDGQIEENLDNFRTVRGIQIARRLVGEEDFRLIDDGTGDRDPLLLATG